MAASTHPLPFPSALGRDKQAADGDPTSQPLPLWALALAWLSVSMLQLGFARSLAVRAVRWLFDQLAFTAWFVAPHREQLRSRFCGGVLDAVRERLLDGRLSFRFMLRWVALLLTAAVHERRVASAYERNRGHRPPAYLIISPSGACNLRCRHCYAARQRGCGRQLDMETVESLIREQHEVWGSSLVVLSGGEPFLYRSGGRSVLDLIVAHPRTFFIVYTNGTRIGAEEARTLAAAGNVALLVSVEGDAAQTDRVRGAGTHARILEAMAHLREAGALFGVSVTASRANADQLGGTAFYRRWVDDEGATFCWVLEQAGVGRGAFRAFDALQLDEKRRLQAALQERIEDGGRLVVSFLHLADALGGCMGARRMGAFLSIDWEGDVRHCVYSQDAFDNLHDLRRRGGNLDDLTREPAMVALHAAGLLLFLKPPADPGLYTPCPADRVTERQALWVRRVVAVSDDVRRPVAVA